MNQNFCRHLRNKHMFMGMTREEAFADRQGADAIPCHCWCNLTQTVVGADDRPASKQTCISSRRCFEPV
jgi:hypothetical protein